VYWRYVSLRRKGAVIRALVFTSGIDWGSNISNR
jgi:hypothetical protein